MTEMKEIKKGGKVATLPAEQTTQMASFFPFFSKPTSGRETKISKPLGVEGSAATSMEAKSLGLPILLKDCMNTETIMQWHEKNVAQNKDKIRTTNFKPHF